MYPAEGRKKLSRSLSPGPATALVPRTRSTAPSSSEASVSAGYAQPGTRVAERAGSLLGALTSYTPLPRSPDPSFPVVSVTQSDANGAERLRGYHDGYCDTPARDGRDSAVHAATWRREVARP